MRFETWARRRLEDIQGIQPSRLHKVELIGLSKEGYPLIQITEERVGRVAGTRPDVEVRFPYEFTYQAFMFFCDGDRKGYGKEYKKARRFFDEAFYDARRMGLGNLAQEIVGLISDPIQRGFI